MSWAQVVQVSATAIHGASLLSLLRSPIPTLTPFGGWLLPCFDHGRSHALKRPYNLTPRSPSLNKDDPGLERVVLAMVRGSKLEVPVLVFCDDLEPVLQWNIHVGGDGPLCV